MAFNDAISGLLVSLYPITDSTIETLSPTQTQWFNKALSTLVSRIKEDGIDQALLDLEFNGIDQPLPFPEAHWELVACWMVIDGTIPPSITLKNGDTLDYQYILLKDQPTLARWNKKVGYARTGFRAR